MNITTIPAIVATLLSLAVAAPASAAVVAGVFVPEATEDYEGTAGGRAILTTLFGGTVAVGGQTQHRSVDQDNWIDFRGSAPVMATSGTRFGVIFGSDSFDLDFSGLGGIFGFGGFATAAGPGDDFLTFFDLLGSEIGSFTQTAGFGPGNGTMAEFSFLSDTAIGSIRFRGTETAYDDLSYSTSVTMAAVPLPASFLLLAGGLLGAGGVLRKRRKAA